MLDPDRGILSFEVAIPEGLWHDEERRMLYCDGVAAGVAALANQVWPTVAGLTPERCEYCDAPYESPSALLACEIRCAQDRGRE